MPSEGKTERATRPIGRSDEPFIISAREQEQKERMSIATFTNIQLFYMTFGESQNQERRHVETYSGRSGPCNGVFVRKIGEACGRLSASKNVVEALVSTLHS